MPQMYPLSWLNLYIFFISIFIFFIIMNFYIYYKPLNNILMKNNLIKTKKINWMW
nr:ATP synthase F0 subunit 8 [Fenusa sp. 1 GYN-2023a]